MSSPYKSLGVIFKTQIFENIRMKWCDKI